MINIISTELEKYLLHEGKAVVVRKYTLMLKRAERELERISVNAPKAEIIIDQLRVVIAGYRSILVAVASMKPDEYMAGDPSLYMEEPVAAAKNNTLKQKKKQGPPETKEINTAAGSAAATKPSKKSTANGKWDKQKEEFLLKNHENMNPCRIAKQLGLAPNTIIYHLKRLGLRDSLQNHFPGGEVDA